MSPAQPMLLAALAVTACTPSAPAVQADFAVVNVNVVDVAQGKVVPGQTVLILGDRIVKLPLSRLTERAGCHPSAAAPCR